MSVTPTSYARMLGADQRCRVLIADVTTGTSELVYEGRDILFEARIGRRTATSSSTAVACCGD